MADLQQYKCPCCGGAIAFDSTLQKMKCPFCDTEFDVDSLKEYDQNLDAVSEDDKMRWEEPGKVWQEGETDDMRVYVCKSCGGQVIGDDTLGATSCPYCGNPIVMMGQFAGDLKPDCIIPFKLTREDAKKAYLKHLEKKPLLPNIFKAQNHIDEIKGVYVPFWLFSGDADGTVHYKATRVRTWRDKDFIYTDTQFYSILRDGSLSFAEVPVDGSEAMPDDLMESIEPFDFSEAVDFQTAYFAGYLANRYDVTMEQSIDRANQRIKKTTEDAFRGTVHGYNTVTAEDSTVKLTNNKSSYAMYPVWLLNTTYKGEKYLFAMNGQTGKMVGDLPVDKGKLWKYRGIFTGAAGFVFFWLFMLIFYWQIF